MSIYTAEISNLRDFPRPRPTLLHVCLKREEEEKKSAAAAKQTAWGAFSDSGNKIFTWYTKPVKSAAFKGFDLSALFLSSVMTCCYVPTHPRVRKGFLFETLCQKYLHSSNLFKSHKHQRGVFLTAAGLCVQTGCIFTGSGFWILDCSSSHFYISDDKIEFVLLNACIPHWLKKYWVYQRWCYLTPSTVGGLTIWCGRCTVWSDSKDLKWMFGAWAVARNRKCSSSFNIKHM